MGCVRRAAVGAAGLVVWVACSSSDTTRLEHDESVGLPQQPAATASLGAVTLSVSSAAALSSLEIVVEDADGKVVLRDTVEPTGAAFEIDFEARAAEAYALRLTGVASDGQRCSGSARFDVASEATTVVPVALACSAAGAESCAELELALSPSVLHVGETLPLAAAVEVGTGFSTVWTSSGGRLEDARGAEPTFTCTEAGPVLLAVTAVGSECSETATVDITCEPAPASACSDLGSTCHVVDPGSGPLHECHELGHAGDEAACGVAHDGCVQDCGAALCEALGSLCHDVDPGSGPLHECHELGHAGDAAACFERGRECFDACTEARQALLTPLTLEFRATVGDAEFACGTTYEGVGSTGVSVEPRDLRFYVSDVQLLTAAGAEVPLEIEERAPWQLPGVALLDFENKQGACVEGTVETNARVTGGVPAGDYVGVSFRMAVPEDVNHADPAALPAPLELGAMSWGWLLGFKFLRVELAETGEGATGLGVAHLGSTACSGNPQAGTVSCARPNANQVQLDGFDPAANAIVFDVGALFAGSDLSLENLCHGADAACEPLMQNLGLDFATGAPLDTQAVFRVD